MQELQSKRVKSNYYSDRNRRMFQKIKKSNLFMRIEQNLESFSIENDAKSFD